MAARIPLASLTAALTLLAAGCGGGGAAQDSSEDFQGERKRVAQTVEDLQEAGAKRDGNEICERLLARELLERIRDAGTKCADAMDDALNDADAFELEVKTVTVTGATATAKVRSEAGEKDRTDELRLVREGRNWKIASLGS